MLKRFEDFRGIMETGEQLGHNGDTIPILMGDYLVMEMAKLLLLLLLLPSSDDYTGRAAGGCRI